ncbi:MAG: PriCT-2 domain-containing protein, partial [Dialister sp.]|nr:PriCT-2 domain-containing protein [Dialister sp.]
MSKIDLRPLMNYIDPVSATYDEWLAVGMALEHEGYPYQVWDEWSRKDPTRYIEGECEKKYITFRGNPNPVTGATIVQMAKSGGWASMKSKGESSMQHTTGRIIDWDDAISDDTKIVDSHYVENAELQEPKDGKWQQIDDLIRYLEAVFRPS